MTEDISLEAWEWLETEGIRHITDAMTGEYLTSVSAVKPLIAAKGRKTKTLVGFFGGVMSDGDFSKLIRWAARREPTHVAFVSPHMSNSHREAVDYLNSLNVASDRSDAEGVIFAAFQIVKRGERMQLHRLRKPELEID